MSQNELDVPFYASITPPDSWLENTGRVEDFSYPPVTSVKSEWSGNNHVKPEWTGNNHVNGFTDLTIKSEVYQSDLDFLSGHNSPDLQFFSGDTPDTQHYTNAEAPKHEGQFSTSDQGLPHCDSGSTLEYSPIDLQNLPSPLNRLSTDTLSSSDMPDSSSQSPEHPDQDCFGGTDSSPRDWKNNALKYPPCVVCSGKSSGLHYGCYTCEACKNFFRRYLLRSGGFVCKKSNNCVISNKSRGNCSGCRLKKCLSVGMDKHKSKIGRYTHAQRTETIREVNKLEGKEDSNLDFQAGPVEQSPTKPKSMTSAPDNLIKQEPIEQFEKLTEEDFQLIGTLVKMMHAVKHFGERGATPEGREEIIAEHYERYLAKVKQFGPLKAIPKDEYFTLLKLYNIDLDDRWNRFKKDANNCAHIVTRYCEFAYSIPGFQQLNLQDQEALLKIGHCDFFLILLHEGYCPKRRVFLEMNGIPSHVEEAADKIFSRELVELQVELSYRWQCIQLLKEEKALLMAMSLLCSDRIELVDPVSVSNLHSKLTNILLKFMEMAHGTHATRRFAKFIDILTFSRQASHGYFKEYSEMSKNEMVTTAAPAFPTLCPDEF